LSLIPSCAQVLKAGLWQVVELLIKQRLQARADKKLGPNPSRISR